MVSGELSWRIEIWVEAAAVFSQLPLHFSEPSLPTVDWSAHLGGLVAGFCVGMVIFALDLKKWSGLVLWLILGTIISLAYFTIVFQEMYSGEVDPPEELRDVCGYYKQFFNDYECKCMRGQQN